MKKTLEDCRLSMDQLNERCPFKDHTKKSAWLMGWCNAQDWFLEVIQAAKNEGLIKR
jgi:hypothetical protein